MANELLAGSVLRDHVLGHVSETKIKILDNRPIFCGTSEHSKKHYANEAIRKTGGYHYYIVKIIEDARLFSWDDAQDFDYATMYNRDSKKAAEYLKLIRGSAKSKTLAFLEMDKVMICTYLYFRGIDGIYFNDHANGMNFGPIVLMFNTNVVRSFELNDRHVISR